MQKYRNERASEGKIINEDILGFSLKVMDLWYAF